MENRAAQLRANLSELANSLADFGAVDSEGISAIWEVEDAAAVGNPFPLKGHNPFQLYESRPGWKLASRKLVAASKAYWRAAVKERLGL